MSPLWQVHSPPLAQDILTSSSFATLVKLLHTPGWETSLTLIRIIAQATGHHPSMSTCRLCFPESSQVQGKATPQVALQALGGRRTQAHPLLGWQADFPPLLLDINSQEAMQIWKTQVTLYVGRFSFLGLMSRNGKEALLLQPETSSF